MEKCHRWAARAVITFLVGAMPTGTMEVVVGDAVDNIHPSSMIVKPTRQLSLLLKMSAKSYPTRGVLWVLIRMHRRRT